MSAQPIDPRLEASDAVQAAYQAQAQAQAQAAQAQVAQAPSRHQPAPYPAPALARSDSQIKLYREAAAAQTAQQAQDVSQPYYGYAAALPPGHSPSDDDGDRRGSAVGADMVDMSPGGAAMLAADAKRSRACEACRGLKVRCDMDNSGQPCKRCAKAGRQCIVTQPSRRRQKKADTRVAELEKKIDALTQVLHQQQQHPHLPLQPPLQPDPYPQPTYDPVNKHEPPLQDADYDTDDRRKRRRVDDPYRPAYHTVYVDFGEYVKQRVRQIIDWNSACTIFVHFRDRLVPEFPAIVLPSDATPEWMLENKPILFLCITAAACFRFVDIEVQDALTDEVFDVLATAVIRKGLKSLEIIQGLQVAFLWHKPPDRPAQANFYMLIHMAVVMSLDVGLGKRFNPNKVKRGFGGAGADLPPGPGSQLVDSDTIESRRAWLTCYYTSASVSQVLRRPNLLRWSNYMQECVDILETSADAAPTDALFTQHIKIQRICDEISVSFAMEDSTASISILDPKIAYTLEVLQKKLDQWEQDLPPHLKLPNLMFYRHVTSLYLHEIGLHVNHNTDDFKVPFSEGSLKSGSHFSETLSQKQMTSIEACLTACHSVIGTFCDFGPEVVSTLPALLYFVRIVYALVVLIKMHVAATYPGSELGKVIKPEDIRAPEFLERVYHCFVALSQGSSQKAFQKAHQILSLLREWISSHPNGIEKEANARGAQPQRVSSRDNDSLRVLSEAATAGADQSNQRANWGFDSPYAPASQYPSHEAPNQTSRSQSDAYSNPATYAPTVMSTPNSVNQQVMSANDASAYANMLDPSFAKQIAGTEWTQGLDFEQAIDVALSGLDFSGDLYTSFFGDGADAFQIPPDAAANGGRW
ncbi:hypothetical protein E4T42_08286 [Aureobasidium subglaciale]|nr:hypothetical protein E4T38_08013 [Aureobasidium subglaciale]KAI5216331.1 hypothetical protein E4T40_08023 [Aureobasidium subglaciale]KAI5219553.1 hypothetical protein E4T41_07938 [Aureobasidium subglaciale]KAI5240730.1 hypothetical protein E4T42_08286 [Aureobasidium subglaciale]KAI5257593.1 hypothetical protein E4T46_07914 [Aureobasidium subglaciale]